MPRHTYDEKNGRARPRPVIGSELRRLMAEADRRQAHRDHQENPAR